MKDKKFYVLMYGDKFYAPYFKSDASAYMYIEDTVHDDLTFAVRFGNKDIAKHMLRLDTMGRATMGETGFDPSLSKVVEVNASTLEMTDVQFETEE